MWRRVEIANFRSIESADVDLAPFTLIVGPNGSGKSNFADAIVFARDVGVDAMSAVQSRGGIAGVRRWSRSKPYDVHVAVEVSPSQDSFDADCFRHELTIKSERASAWRFTRESVVRKSRGKTLISWRRVDDLVQGDDDGYAPDEVPPTTSIMLFARQMFPHGGIGSGTVRRIRLNPDEMRKPQAASESEALGESGANVAAVVGALRNRKADYDAVIASMRRIVPGLLDLSVSTDARFHSLRFRQKNRAGAEAEFSASEMSEGSLRALGIIVAARMMRRHDLLIIEEPEANVHPGAATVIFDVLKEASKRGAVLVTSHSPELLDAARDEEILVCQYESGVTRIGPMASAQRDAVRNGLLTAADLMRSEPLRIEGVAPPVLSIHDL